MTCVWNILGNKPPCLRELEGAAGAAWVVGEPHCQLDYEEATLCDPA